MTKSLCKSAIAILTSILVLTTTPVTSGQGTAVSGFTPVAPIATALAKLNRNSADQWTVQWNTMTGLPARLDGRTTKVYKGSTDKVAEEFIAEYRALFTGLAAKDDPGHISFSVDPGTPIAPGMRMIMVPQRYKGLRVNQTALSVRIDADGHVISASGNPVRIDNLSIKPGITPEDAIASIRKALRPDSLGAASTPELVLHRSSPPVLAYRVSAMTWRGKNAGSGEFIVDATNGKILHPSQEYLRRRAGEPEVFQRIDR